MKVSVIIPCFNERSTIAKIVAAVRAAPIEDLELIVVDDASTDGTTQLLGGEISRLIDRTVFHPANQGKGAALRSGSAAAAGAVSLSQDADLEYNPEGQRFRLERIFSGKADAGFGSRFMGG